MIDIKKLTIGVVFGGQSAEHDISIMSTYNVLRAIDSDKYNIITIGITKRGIWKRFSGKYELLIQGNWQRESIDIHNLRQLFDELDVIFPILHGPMGEDGTIQGLFEVFNVPYIGCDVLSSSIAMDKFFGKIIFEKAGLPVLEYVLIYNYDWNNKREEIYKEIGNKLNFPYSPVFIKPVNMGSSIGIKKVHKKEDISKAIEEGFKYDRKVLVEKYIDCREIECSVIGNNEGNIKASCVGEILPSKDFYDYDAKYCDNGDSRILIPANLDFNIIEKIRNYAILAFRSIEGKGLGRIDFFIGKKDGEIYLNEINTMPGFTNISMYPKLWEASGISYSELLDNLIDLAIIEFHEKKKYKYYIEDLK